MTLINRDEAITKLEALFAKMAKNRYDRADESLGREVECISEQVTEALRALPVSDGVTDEMVERVARAICAVDAKGLNCYPRCNKAGACLGDLEGKTMEQARAALEAALGPLPAPPTIE